MKTPPPSSDPFKQVRKEKGVLETSFSGEEIPMILGLKEVRAAANNWKTFSSDTPFRVPIPSEEKVRTVRQLPIETDPPDHTDFRKIVEPFFLQPKEPQMIGKIEKLVARLIAQAFSRPSIEIIREFAIPLQSIALTYLLRVPESEADEWVGWGTHIFKDGDGEVKGSVVDQYIRRQIARAKSTPGDDFFSVMAQVQFRGRKLTDEEIMGYANLAFAGGRDTIIQTVSSILSYFGSHPEALEALRSKPEWINTAAEEFFRYVTPLTHIGRTCKHATEVSGVPVKEGQRVSLCWSSANRDETVFENSDEVKLDRKPNPHIAFGSGAHNCLGAHHARLIVRTLLEELSRSVGKIEIVETTPHVENEKDYVREIGYDQLFLRLMPLK